MVKIRKNINPNFINNLNYLIFLASSFQGVVSFSACSRGVIEP